MTIYIVLINNEEFGYVDCCPFKSLNDAMNLFNELRECCIDNEEEIEREEYDMNDPEAMAFFMTSYGYQVIVKKCEVE